MSVKPAVLISRIFGLLVPLVLAFGLPALLPAQSVPLAYRPVAAEYSAALDRIIMVSATPDQLHIYDPVSLVDIAVNLPKPPLALSVSPDGFHAAVGHDAAVSYVNLATGTVDRTYTTTLTPIGVAAAASWIHVWGYNSALSVNIATGATSTGNSYFFSVTGGRLDPAANAIYGTRDGTSPNDVEKLDVSTGPITSQTDSVYHGDYNVCNGVFLSPDGSRIYTGCATVFHASTDPTLDMRYLSTFTGISTIRTLSESAAIKRIAVIENVGSYYYNQPSVSDAIVKLFESDHLNPAGQFTLSDFTIGASSYASHGKWVFFNAAGTSLYAVKEADTTSGLLNDFAVQTIPMGAPVPCGAAFATTSATAIAAGVRGSVNITAAQDCRYQATSSDTWLQVVSGGYGGGNGSLTYIVRPNATASPRTATLSLGASTFTVTQDAAAAPTSFTRLPDNIVDTAYDKPLDKLVYVSSAPNELHFYDPTTHTDRVTPLVMAPLAVSVSPDGQYAAVGHDGWMSYINLTNGAVIRIFQEITDVHTLVLASNGYAYLFPARAWSDIYSLNLTTGLLTAISAIYDGRIPRLSADGNTIYLGDSSWGSEWDISNGTLSQLPRNAYGVSTCGNFWLTADGTRMFTSCGSVYRVSPVASLDLQYAGKLNDIGGITWADQSPVRQTTAVIPTISSYTVSSADTEVRLYGDAFLGFSGNLALPKFPSGGSNYTGHGLWTFWNGASSALHVIEKADSTSNLLSPYGVFTISPSTAADGCSFSLGRSYASEAYSGGYDSVNVSTGANCVWTASSNAAWLTVSTGTFGFGATTLSFSTLPNTQAASRSATLTIGGQTLTVTQAGNIVGTTSVGPSSGSGASQVFTATYTDTNGYADLAFVQLLIAASPTGGGQSYCFVHYDVRGNGLWLYGPGGFFIGPVAPGATSNLLQNSLCAIDTSATAVVRSASLLTLSVKLVFKDVGARNTYLRAQTISGVDTGWVQQGSFTPVATAVLPMSGTPSSGSGSTQTFSLTYPDAPGFTGNSGWVQFLVAAASNGGGQPFCFVHYDRAGNGLWMYSSDVGYFAGPVAPGTVSNALSSSACSVDTAHATAVSGGGNLVVTVPITFKAPMAGAKFLYQRTLDLLTRDTGWQQTGSWTVQ